MVSADRTGIVAFSSSSRFAEHETGPHHPERPDRIRAVALAVRAAGLVESTNPFPDFQLDLQLSPVGGKKLMEIEPTPAALEDLLRVHTAKEIETVRRVSQVGGGVLDQGDTPAGPKSYEIALLSCGSALRCADAVMEGKALRAFSAARPPGHHAEPDHAMGFCLFNNVAVTARYIQAKYGVKRVAIVDFDVHHGNGTQAAFEDDPSVLFVSLHQHPRTCYPGTGNEWEVGEGPGRGTILNIPMMPGSGDEEYLAAFGSQVLPKLDSFGPEMLLISAGFDAHMEDPLAQMNVTEDCFFKMTRLLVESAERHCGGRVVSVLEGGYNLRALGRSVVRHLVGLRNDEL
jgi:acetoin utilization deacetylase AcuC-like enzyme